MERLDLGDNSSQFIVSSSDTIKTIQEGLLSFLTFRGWSLILEEVRVRLSSEDGNQAIVSVDAATGM